MRLRVISPRLRFQIYFLIELIAVPFFFMTLYGGIPSFDSTFELISWLFVFLLFLSAVLSPILIEKTSFGADWFYLDTTGVTYSTRKLTYHLDWSQVKHMMLSPDAYARTTKNCFICFYADEIPSWLPMRTDYTPTAFGLQYRKGLPEIIAQYCSLPIENLEKFKRENND